MINVTKTFLPPLDEYNDYLKKIWKSGWITNQGPLIEELEEKLKQYLGVKNLLIVSNGTIALQFAIKALELSGEVLTTPYSYVATTTSILWENCKPVFCDIEPRTFCIDPNKIEEKITENTSGILATNVYGFPCDFRKIKSIADRHNLRVIYDGAHAFAVKIKDKSIFNFGDISTVSFHATKLFHTIEGGAVITNDDMLSEKIYLYRAFGHLDNDYFSVGINGRTSEFNAAMGLCILPRINDFIEYRKSINDLYRDYLKNTSLVFPSIPKDIFYNYSYFPAVFPSEKIMLKVKDALAENDIFTRRYFYPSLNKLPYLNISHCPVSEELSEKILCLPLSQEIRNTDIKYITDIIIKYLDE